MRKRRDNQSFKRQFLIRGLIYGTLAFLIFAAAASGEPTVKNITLSDIAYIEGQPVPLTGYGLVTGLDGTGDGSVLPHTERSLLATLGHLGIDPKGHRVSPGAVAAVLVQTELPAGYLPGGMQSIRITALGDATDLTGGTLVPVTLYSRDKRYTGTASGQLAMGHGIPQCLTPASGTIDRAFTSANAVFLNSIPELNFVVEVRGLDANQLEQLALLINRKFGAIARAHSGCDIEINLPDTYSDFDERAGLVLQLAAMPVDEIVPQPLAERSTGGLAAQ